MLMSGKYFFLPLCQHCTGDGSVFGWAICLTDVTAVHTGGRLRTW